MPVNPTYLVKDGPTPMIDGMGLMPGAVRERIYLGLGCARVGG